MSWLTNLRSTAALLWMLGCLSATAESESPFGRPLIPDFIADASIVEIDGTFYCYATTDGWGDGLKSSGVPVVWKSKDFVNWSFEGSIYPANFAAKYWAPSKPFYHAKHWFLFPTLDGKITATVSDSLEGPFRMEDGKDIHPNSGWKPFPIEQKSAIDAELFRDSTGDYMYYSRRRVVKLKPDLSGPEGPVETINTGENDYSEGPCVFKRNGIYYYLYTLGGNESYVYAYVMSRESPLGPWTIPAEKIIAKTDATAGIYGPGHGSVFNPAGSEQWYFAHLEYGRGGTNRQTFVQKLDFNADGTIRPVQLTNQGVGALKPITTTKPNLALKAKTSASSIHPDLKINPTKDSSLNRTETFSADLATDDSNGSRWMAAPGDKAPWWEVDLGKVEQISHTEAYFVKPTAGHAYRLEASIDGKTWAVVTKHPKLAQRSPHIDNRSIHARYLRIYITQGEPGLWEFRVYPK